MPKNKRRMKAEIRNPKSEGNPKSESRKPNLRCPRFSDFGIRISFGFRISDFGFQFAPLSHA